MSGPSASHGRASGHSVDGTSHPTLSPAAGPRSSIWGGTGTGANEGQPTTRQGRRVGQKGEWPLLPGWEQRGLPGEGLACRREDGDSDEPTPAEGLKQGGQREASEVNWTQARVPASPCRGECDAEEDRGGCRIQASSGDQAGGRHFLHQNLHHGAHHGDQLQDRGGV